MYVNKNMSQMLQQAYSLYCLITNTQNLEDMKKMNDTLNN